jgi:hypothetical protein
LASIERAPLPTIALGVEGWTLRAWRESDSPTLARHANNINVWRWIARRSGLARRRAGRGRSAINH